MLARGHRIRIGEGAIGWCIANNRWWVADAVGLESQGDAVRLATPELPDTRSEAALPLRSRGQVLGAITVQDARAAAFDEDTLVVLQIMADQVAVALDNAQLFAESERALEAERRAYGEISRQAWVRLVEAERVEGYRCGEVGMIPASGDLPALAAEAVSRGEIVLTHDGVGIPVTVRGQVVGVVHFRRGENGASSSEATAGAEPVEGVWSWDEIALIEGMAEQLGQALESARLYQDSQRRAAQDRLTGEITGRIRETLDVETVLQTAVDEIRQAFKLDRAAVRLVVPEGHGAPPAGGMET
jgi:GAF domain-containing protein